LEVRFDACVGVAKLEDELDGIDQKSRRFVVFEPYRLRRGDIGRKIEHGPCRGHNLRETQP